MKWTEMNEVKNYDSAIGLTPQLNDFIEIAKRDKAKYTLWVKDEGQVSKALKKKMTMNRFEIKTIPQ